MTLIVFCLFSGKNTQDIGLPQQNSPILDFRTIQELVDVKYTKKQITFLDGGRYSPVREEFPCISVLLIRIKNKYHDTY